MENKLAEQSSSNYRGDDTDRNIPVVDVVHSINLLACTVSDHKWWCKIQGRGKYNYYVPNRGLELECHKPSDPLGGGLHVWGQLNRHSRRAAQNSWY